MPRHLSAAKIKHFHDITKYLPNYFIHAPLSVIFPLRILATALQFINVRSFGFLALPFFNSKDWSLFLFEVVLAIEDGR